MHCAIKNAQFHSVFSMVKNWCIRAYWDVVSYYRDDEQSISPINFFNILNLKSILNWFFKKSSFVSEIRNIVFLSIDAFLIVTILYTYVTRVGLMLINTTNSYMNWQKKKNVRIIYTYIRWRTEDPFFHFPFFFCFLAGAFHLLWKKWWKVTCNHYPIHFNVFKVYKRLHFPERLRFLRFFSNSAGGWFLIIRTT